MKTLKDKLYITREELDKLEQQGTKIALIGNVGDTQILYIDSEKYILEKCTGNKIERYKIIKCLEGWLED